MDLEPGMVSSSFFYQYLENHIDIDQVFVDFYKRVDIDLESIWKTPPNELTEEEQWAKLALVKEIAKEVWG